MNRHARIRAGERQRLVRFSSGKRGNFWRGWGSRFGEDRPGNRADYKSRVGHVADIIFLFFSRFACRFSSNVLCGAFFSVFFVSCDLDIGLLSFRRNANTDSDSS